MAGALQAVPVRLVRGVPGSLPAGTVFAGGDGPHHPYGGGGAADGHDPPGSSAPVPEHSVRNAAVRVTASTRSTDNPQRCFTATHTPR